MIRSQGTPFYILSVFHVDPQTHTGSSPENYIMGTNLFSIPKECECRGLLVFQLTSSSSYACLTLIGQTFYLTVISSQMFSGRLCPSWASQCLFQPPFIISVPPSICMSRKPARGGFVAPLFRLTLLYVRQKPGMGGPNFPPSEVVIKPGCGRSGACV